MRQTCHIDRPGVCSEEVRRPKAAPPPSAVLTRFFVGAWQQAFIGNGHPGGQNTCEKGYANWKGTDGAADPSAGLASHKFSGSQLTKVQTGLKDSLQVFSQDGTYVDWDLCYAIDDGLVKVSFAELIFRPSFCGQVSTARVPGRACWMRSPQEPSLTAPQSRTRRTAVASSGRSPNTTTPRSG